LDCAVIRVPLDSLVPQVTPVQLDLQGWVLLVQLVLLDLPDSWEPAVQEAQQVLRDPVVQQVLPVLQVQLGQQDLCLLFLGHQEQQVLQAVQQEQQALQVLQVLQVLLVRLVLQVQLVE
jgi:hypothetical protein